MRPCPVCHAPIGVEVVTCPECRSPLADRQETQIRRAVIRKEELRPFTFLPAILLGISTLFGILIAPFLGFSLMQMVLTGAVAGALTGIIIPPWRGRANERAEHGGSGLLLGTLLSVGVGWASSSELHLDRRLGEFHRLDLALVQDYNLFRKRLLDHQLAESEALRQVEAEFIPRIQEGLQILEAIQREDLSDRMREKVNWLADIYETRLEALRSLVDGARTSDKEKLAQFARMWEEARAQTHDFNWKYGYSGILGSVAILLVVRWIRRRINA